MFLITWKSAAFLDTLGWPVQSDIFHAVILASEQHLLEVRKGKDTISIRIKELNELFALSQSCSVAVVVSKEVQDIVTVDMTASLTINSVEGRSWGKLANSANAVSETLKVYFTLTNSHEQVLQSVL